MRQGGGNKYHARRTGGNASRKEARREAELRLLQRAGQISQLRTQVPFLLIPAQYGPGTTGPRGGKKRGKCLERSVVYVADFVYLDRDKGLYHQAEADAVGARHSGPRNLKEENHEERKKTGLRSGRLPVGQRRKAHQHTKPGLFPLRLEPCGEHPPQGNSPHQKRGRAVAQGHRKRHMREES